MGFREKAYARVWSAEDKGKYSVGNVSISRKNQNTNQYEIEFQDGYVRFVGNAHEAIKNMTIPEKGASIQITSCDVTNRYDPQKKKTYTNFVIFGFEVPDGNGKGSNKSSNKSSKSKDFEVEAPDDEDDLPF